MFVGSTFKFCYACGQNTDHAIYTAQVNGTDATVLLKICKACREKKRQYEDHDK